MFGFVNKRYTKEHIRAGFRVIMAIAILLLSAAVYTVTAEASEVDLGVAEAEVSVGLAGQYRQAAGVPVSVEITSQTDFEGTLRFLLPDTDRGRGAYETEISLKAGCPETIDFVVYSNFYLNICGLQLLDGNGNPVESQEFATKAECSNRPLVGILSKDAQALAYFNGNQINWGDGMNDSSVTLALTGEDIPAVAEGLEALSYLIVNDFDTGSLREEQRRAILEWTASGGVLIVGMGARAEEALPLLSDGGIEPVMGEETERSFTLYGNQISQIFCDGKAGSHKISLPDGEELPQILEEEGLICRKAYGNGDIVLLAFDPGAEPITSWGFRMGFAANLLSEAPGTRAWERITRLREGYYDSKAYVMQNLQKGDRPNAKLLLALVFAFAWLPPLTFLTLRKKQRVQYLWAMVPAEAVLFAGLILFCTAKLRVREPIISTLTFFDGAGAEGQVYMEIITPEMDNNKILFSDDVTRLRMDEDYYYYTSRGMTDNSRKNECSYIVRNTEAGYQLTINSHANFETAYSCFVNREPAEGTLTAEISRNISGIHGSVTNETGRDLRGVCVYSVNSVTMIGDLKAGETREFEEEDSRSFRYSYDIDYSKIAGPEEQNAINTLYEDTYAYMMGQSPDRNRILLVGYEENAGMHYAQNIAAENDIAVYRSTMEVYYEDYPEAANLRLYNYAEDASDWDRSDGQLYATFVETTIDLSEEIEEIYAMICPKDNFTFRGNSANTNVYIYNYRTGGYEEIFGKNEEAVSFGEECPYISDGIVKMRFLCKSEYEDYAPDITVIGGKK